MTDTPNATITLNKPLADLLETYFELGAGEASRRRDAEIVRQVRSNQEPTAACVPKEENVLRALIFKARSELWRAK